MICSVLLRKLRLFGTCPEYLEVELSKEIIMTFHKMFPLFYYYETKYWAE